MTTIVSPARASVVIDLEHGDAYASSAFSPGFRLHVDGSAPDAAGARRALIANLEYLSNTLKREADRVRAEG